MFFVHHLHYRESIMYYDTSCIIIWANMQDMQWPAVVDNANVARNRKLMLYPVALNQHTGVRVLHGFDFIECFTTTFLRAHSWLNWVFMGA